MNVACLVWKMMIWSHEKTVSVFQLSIVNGTCLNCIFVVNSSKKKKKEKLKFIHTIRNDFSCVYGNAVQFNYADPKFLMFLLLLLLLFFLFEGGCINLKLFH